mgnify:CR=1 FL=1
MKRMDLRGVGVLVALARCSGASWEKVIEAVGEALQLNQPNDGVLDRTLAKETAKLSWKDSVSALIHGAPLIESLVRHKVGNRVIARIVTLAQQIIDALIDFQPRGDRGLPRLADLPEVEAVLRQPLRHRFIAPIGSRTGRADLRGSVGWGSWHVVLESPDDLLLWSLAHALESNTLSHLGRCAECEEYYVADKRGRHRFCSPSCRDRYWNRTSGAERTRKSRGKEDRNRGSRQRPRSRGSRVGYTFPRGFGVFPRTSGWPWRRSCR